MLSRPGRSGRGVLLTFALLAAAGCGKKGPPLPPLGHRPETPQEIVVTQRGDQLEIALQLPARYTDGEPMTIEPSLVVLRSAPGGRPQPVRRFAPGEIDLAPGKAARVTISMAAVFEGLPSDRALLSIEIDPAAGKPSRPSSPVPVPRAEPPPPPDGLALADLPEGMRLTWEAPPPEGQGLEYNVHRRLSTAEGWGVPRNPQPLGDREFVDTDVVFGATYEYQVRAMVPGSSPVRESLPAHAGPLRRVDRYAPAPPTAVRAVSEPDGIRIFWFPPPDPDLAGFRVYRAVPGEGAGELRAELPATIPTFLDDEVVAGRSYEYRVTAVDTADPPNESPPSEPASEVAPAVPSPGAP